MGSLTNGGVGETVLSRCRFRFEGPPPRVRAVTPTGGVGFSETRQACSCISSISSVGRENIRDAFQREPGRENDENFGQDRRVRSRSVERGRVARARQPPARVRRAPRRRGGPRTPQAKDLETRFRRTRCTRSCRSRSSNSRRDAESRRPRVGATVRPRSGGLRRGIGIRGAQSRHGACIHRDFGIVEKEDFGRSWEPFPFGEGSPSDEGSPAYAFFIRARAMYPFLSRKYM
jgi:hypothetical protein